MRVLLLALVPPARMLARDKRAYNFKTNVLDELQIGDKGRTQCLWHPMEIRVEPLRDWRLGGDCDALVTLDGDIEIRRVPIRDWSV